MSMTILSTPELPAVVDAFIWPAPAYRDFTARPEAGIQEQCLVVLSDGRKLQGTLLASSRASDDGFVRLTIENNLCAHNRSTCLTTGVLGKKWGTWS